jgi:hypothetical protein
MIRKWETSKRRQESFLLKLKKADTAKRQINLRTESELQALTLAFLLYTNTRNAFSNLRNLAAFWYCFNMFSRGEDPRNRRLGDLHTFDYPPAGIPGAPPDNFCK